VDGAAQTYASAGYWDDYFAGHDLDWGDTWTGAFLPRLRAAGAQSVLELGCGTGNDAARLARAGLQVVAVDFSAAAIGHARRRHGTLDIRFEVADIARPLPFGNDRWDGVMANVALHMFSDAVTRAIFAEVERVVRPGGLFLFHVNSTDDRPLRARRRPVRHELEPNFVLEEAGQTVRFFDEGYLRELLRSWDDVELERVELCHDQTGEPFKRVWRASARGPTRRPDIIARWPRPIPSASRAQRTSTSGASSKLPAHCSSSSARSSPTIRVWRC
jgi:SAM-dependent methyltransferase